MIKRVRYKERNFKELCMLLFSVITIAKCKWKYQVCSRDIFYIFAAFIYTSIKTHMPTKRMLHGDLKFR